jgi:hypothetical protein
VRQWVNIIEAKGQLQRRCSMEDFNFTRESSQCNNATLLRRKLLHAIKQLRFLKMIKDI